MPRVLEKLLHVHGRIAECGTRFRLGHGDRVDQGGLGMHHPHAATPAAACSLDDDGVANRLGNPAHLRGVIGQFTFGARNAWDARLDHGLFG